jgi:trehalose 6-phosphate phosphatase
VDVAAADLESTVPEPAPAHLPGAPANWALFLDLDGTLIDIAPTPESVIVPKDLPATLRALSPRFGGALAIVTGRHLADVDRLLEPLRLPVAGLHGAMMRLAPGAPEEIAYPVFPDPLRRALARFAQTAPGLLFEDKGASVAVHYRLAPHLADEVAERVATLVADLGPAHELQPGKMVVEVKPHGIDKGAAVRTFLSHAPFRGRLPAVMGDDLTDEAAFRAARGAGGIAVFVGELRRPTAATHILPNTAAVRAWLGAQAAGID